jgi:hypothetical protein
MEGCLSGDVESPCQPANRGADVHGELIAVDDRELNPKTAEIKAEFESFLSRFPEHVMKARVQFWACPDHFDKGIVEWRGDIAYCMEDGCGRDSTQPRES